MTRRTRRIASLVLCALPSVAFGSEPEGLCPRRSSIEAAAETWRSVKGLDSVASTSYGVREAAITEPTWPEIRRFLPGTRVLILPEDPLTRKSDEEFYVVLIAPSCAATPVLDPQLREVIAQVRTQFRGMRDAESLARLLLRLKRVSSLMNDGYEDGAHILQRASDVAFRNDDERVSVESEGGIEKPRVLPGKNGFAWRFYAWASVGSGSITRNTLDVDFENGVALTQEVVLRNIGLWRQSR